MERSYYGRDVLGKFSWPPRPYTCSFCKREFRSAQALGGHMNVHRRDRARLRQSPPYQSAPNLSPNPIFNSSSASTNYNQLPPFTYTFPSLPTPPAITCLTSSTSAEDKNISSKQLSSPFGPSSSKGSENLKKTNVMKTYIEFGELKGFMQEDQYCNNLKKGEIVRLDLEIGLCPTDDLDLELRLGY